MIARLRASETVRQGVLVFGGIVLANLFNYLYYMLMGRRLGVEAYGVVTSLVSTILVLGAPANVAQLIAARIAADLQARKDRAALRRLADLVTWWSLGAAGVLVAIGLLGRELLSAYFHLSSSEPIAIGVVAYGIFVMTIVQRGVLQGAHHFGTMASSMAIEAVVKVVAGVLLTGPFGSNGALVAVGAGSLISVAYNLVAFRLRFGRARAPVPLHRAEIVRVISQVGLGQLTLTLLSFYDTPLVKHLFDARTAGLYAAAALVGRAVLAAGSFIPILVLPKATARAAEGRSPLPLLTAGLGLGLLVAATATLFATVAPVFTVTIIAGRAFGEAASLVLPYVLASSALSLASIVATYRMGLQRYGFVWPMIGVAIAEIATVSWWHPSPVAVVSVLAIGHSAALLLMLVGVNRPALSNETGGAASEVVVSNA